MTDVFFVAALVFVAAADGDTLTVRDPISNQRVQVRLAEVDAPERTQPYSQVSRRNLISLCQGRSIEIEKVDTDRYGRTVAHVRCDDVHVNWRQVEDGLAWCFAKYLKHPEVCLPLEKDAREAKKGLWREPNAQAPWEFRAGKKEQ